MRRLLRRYARTHGIARKKKEPLLIERFPVILIAMPDALPAARELALEELLT